MAAWPGTREEDEDEEGTREVSGAAEQGREHRRLRYDGVGPPRRRVGRARPEPAPEARRSNRGRIHKIALVS